MITQQLHPFGSRRSSSSFYSFERCETLHHLNRHPFQVTLFEAVTNYRRFLFSEIKLFCCRFGHVHPFTSHGFDPSTIRVHLTLMFSFWKILHKQRAAVFHLPCHYVLIQFSSFS